MANVLVSNKGCACGWASRQGCVVDDRRCRLALVGRAQDALSVRGASHGVWGRVVDGCVWNSDFCGWYCMHCAACAFMLATFCAINARGTFGSRGVGPAHSSAATRAMEFVIPSTMHFGHYCQHSIAVFVGSHKMATCPVVVWTSSSGQVSPTCWCIHPVAQECICELHVS